MELDIEVLDQNQGTPIIDAIVSSSNTSHEVRSSPTGTTIIENVCPGNIQLNISHPGYEIHIGEYSIDSNQTISVELIREAIELKPVDIEEYLHRSESQTLTEKILNQSQIDAYAHQNISDALSYLSGVSLMKLGKEISKPIIHGLYGSRVGIVADGHRLSDQEWGADHAPSIDLNAYQSVQLLKGAATLKYGGDTSGGIIVLNPPTINPTDSLYGSVSVVGSSNGLGGSLASRIIKSYDSGFYIKVNGSYKKTRDLFAPDYTLSNTGSRRKNFGIQLAKNNNSHSWKFSGSVFENELGILRAAHIGNVNDLIRAINSVRPWVEREPTFSVASPSQSVVHYSLLGKYSRRFDATTKLSFLYGFQQNNRKEFDIRRGGRSRIPSLNFRLITQNISLDVDWLQSNNWHFNLGATVELQDNYSVPGTGVKRLIPDYFKYKVGSYFSSKFIASNELIFELGARMDYDNLDVKKFYRLKDWQQREYSEKYDHFEIRTTQRSQILTNPKLEYRTIAINSGLYKKFNSDVSLGLNYILTQRAPNVAELFSDGLHHSLATIEIGNLDLKKESIHKVLIDFNKNSGGFQWEITPYVAFAEEYIHLQPTDIRFTVRGSFPVWEYLSVDSNFVGIDVDTEFSFNGNITYQSSFSYVSATESKTNDPLTNMPPLSLNQSVNYTTKSHVNIQLASHWVARQNRYPDTTFEISVIEGGQIVQKEVDLTSPVKGYHLIGLEISKKLVDKGNYSIESRLRVQNLMNLSYREYLNRLRYFSDEAGRTIELQFQIDF